ncbi:MAG: VWA domain-containing protein [Thermomicrobiales bacterium]|nr:VWA domain-containing protein [Thermomicrobiales bacterium]
MPGFRLGARYSRWDGAQQINPLDADDLMRAMSDDLMQDGDINRALQRLFRWGFERQDGEHVPGLRELMDRLREQRQEQLNRYDLGSMLDEIQQKLEQVVQTERDGIQKRLDEARRSADEDVDRDARPEPGSKTAEERRQEQGAQDAAQQGARQRGSESNQSGEASDADQEGESGEGPSDALREMLEKMAARKLEQLDKLPGDPGGQIRELTDYDFMTPEARQQFNELLAMLQQQVLQQTFQGMQQALNQMTPEDLADTRQMMRELNEMLERQQHGEDPNFEQFMHRWGQYFGPNVNNLDDLMQHLQNQMGAMRQLMESMSAEQRAQLQEMMQSVMQDEGIRQEMERLGQNLGRMIPPDQWRNQYRFGGEESLTLAEAMRLMERLNQLDELERDLRDVRDWNDLANLDEARVRDLLGEEQEENMQQLREMTRLLEEAGYVKRTRRGLELTPQGVRKIGEKALTDIFADLKRDRLGQHDLRREGGAGDRTDVTKPYEWGDPFLLDIPKTIMNAVQRGEQPGQALDAGRGVRLIPRDFEVYRTEYATRVSTVLMVDMSRSMLYNGCFHAAKKVALALDSLIRGKFPRDDLSIIGFSYLAQEIKPAELPTLDWNEYNYGTNMQHGFQLARQILGRQKGSNRQIIVITDGEPTAHFENGHVRFSYPPTPRTFQETLREVVRCTRDGITINTFMLERSPYMVQFINDLMRINGGRVFVATPDRLGEYILVDYVANKRKWIG